MTSPLHSSRITATASESIAARPSQSGHRSPRTCSFRFSPVPTPRKNRPGIRLAAVAAAWAMMAGWIRIVGQVTPVPMVIRSVASAIAPRTPQTNGLWPCRSIQGWKWSEMTANVKPASSASAAWRTRSRRRMLLAGQGESDLGAGRSVRAGMGVLRRSVDAPSHCIGAVPRPCGRVTRMATA